MTRLGRIAQLCGILAGTVHLCACIAFPWPQEKARPASSTGQIAGEGPWAFGESGGRYDPIWQQGVNARALTRNPQPAVPSEEEREGAFLHMNVENAATSWKVAPMQLQNREPETMARDRHHVVKAFAEVQPDEELTINLGPELILKDNSYAEEGSSVEDPGAAFGLGMSFELEF